MLKKEEFIEECEEINIVKSRSPLHNKNPNHKKPGFILHRSPTPNKENEASPNRYSPSMKSNRNPQMKTPPRH